MNNLKLKILSNKVESSDSGKSTCYLTEASLEDYVLSVPKFYKDYEVQRGIVANVYLDKLAQTILEKKVIPPIVLIGNKNTQIHNNELIIVDYKILDGLQRTFRIKSVYSALNFYIAETEMGIAFDDLSKLKLSKTYKKQLKVLDTDVNVLWTIVKTVNENDFDLNYLKDVFKTSIQWFEVWTELNKKDQINKMLVLNAGHKAMNIKHQLELIFLNVIPSDYLKNFERAKDINSSFFYKNKEVGALHLSHFISALLSFDKQTPLTVDTKFVQSLQDDLETELESIKTYFQESNLTLFIDFMRRLDELFDNCYPATANNNSDGGLAWLGRETVLIGLFAAFGKYYHKECKKLDLKECLSTIGNKIEKNIEIFKIDEFNSAKKTSIDVTKVNIGGVFKKTSFFAMSEFLLNDERNIIWKDLFSPDKGDDDDS